MKLERMKLMSFFFFSSVVTDDGLFTACTPPTMQKEKNKKKKGLGRRAPIVKQLVFFSNKATVLCVEREPKFLNTNY